MISPSLIIHFDFETWKPTEIFLHGNNDEETAKIQEFAEKIVKVISEEVEP